MKKVRSKNGRLVWLEPDVMEQARSIRRAEDEWARHAQEHGHSYDDTCFEEPERIREAGR